jgi:peroxiredoxin
MSFLSKIIYFLIAIIFSKLTNAQTSYISQINNDKSHQILKITGEIPGLQENEPVILKKYFHPFSTTSWRTVDTAYLKNSQFVFEHHLTDGPRLMMIYFPKHRKFAISTLGNENVIINSNWKIDEMPKETIAEFLQFNGSESATDFLYMMAIDRLWIQCVSRINSSLRNYRDSILSKENLKHVWDFITAKRLIANGIQLLFTDNFYAKRNTGMCELFAECGDADRKYDSLWARVYNSLDEQTKNSYYGKLLGEHINLFMGQSAPDFSFKTPDNKLSSLKKISQSNKVTILHFWSNQSDFADLGKYHKEISDLYEKYHLKGLEVVNVSLDANPIKWKRTINEQNIPGFQICDFKEEESEPAVLYKITPKDITNILIDPNGKIIAWDVEGPQLFAYLYSIFKE